MTAVRKPFALSKLNHLFFCLLSPEKDISKVFEGMFLSSSGQEIIWMVD